MNPYEISKARHLLNACHFHARKVVANDDLYKTEDAETLVKHDLFYTLSDHITNRFAREVTAVRQPLGPPYLSVYGLDIYVMNEGELLAALDEAYMRGVMSRPQIVEPPK